MYLLKDAERNLIIDTLPNKLKIATLRSVNTSVPIISISVNVGHYHEQSNDDTKLCYGFAHLLEHMIFHRSQNFNSSDALEKHISQYGGYINGWTHACHTNFHLSCHQDGFLEAATMLCDKIAHPSFRIDDIETEISAIDEEFRLKLQDPIRGLFSVKKAICNPDHPFSRFTVGNKDTFSAFSAQALQAMLKDYHERYFHTGNITVCLKVPVTGDYTKLVQALKQVLAQTIISKESNAALTLPKLHLFSEKSNWIDIRSTQSHCQLILSWFIPTEHSVIDHQALKMLRHLIESQHKNGLVDELVSRKWVTSIKVTGGIEQAHFEEIQIHCALSSDGAEHKIDVINVVAGFLGFLARSNLANWRFIELFKQTQLLEKYGNTGDPVQTCIEIAQSLHGNEIIQNNNPAQLIGEIKTRLNGVLQHLVEAPKQVMFISTHAQQSHTSEFYNVGYSARQMHGFAPDQSVHFMLSAQNTYLPEQLLLVSKELQHDHLEVMNQHGVTLKFAQILDNEQPCGDCFVSINSPQMCDSISHAMSKKIWVEGLSHYIDRRFYQAAEAGISFRVYGHQHGLCIHTTGFSEKQLMLCIEIINCMISFRLHAHEFEHVKQRIIARLTNRLVQKSINQLLANLNTMVQGDTYSIHEQVAALKASNFDELNTHQRSFFDSVCVESLLVGNWRKFAAIRLHQQLQSRLTSKGVWQKPSIRARELSQATMPVLPSWEEPSSPDTSVVLYQQVVQLNEDYIYLPEHATAICLMLEHILGPHVFLKLRTQKKLGYLVGVGYKPINTQAGVVIYLQSSHARPEEIYEGFQSVFDNLMGDWDATCRELEKLRPRIVEQCQPADKNISAIARRLWSSFEQDNAFYSYQRLQQEVLNIEPNEIKGWLAKMRDASQGQVFLSNTAVPIDNAKLSGFVQQPFHN
ncbi:insulinase family protein [Ningiella sp. W23]|uniref:insulinase family protein n=1 Tax=Ningiella sp. W23 TaxID=3023715 RepID=UPI003756F3C1